MPDLATREQSPPLAHPRIILCCSLSYMVCIRFHTRGRAILCGRSLYTELQIPKEFTGTGKQGEESGCGPPKSEVEVPRGGGGRPSWNPSITTCPPPHCLLCLCLGSLGDHAALVTLLKVEVRDGSVPGGILRDLGEPDRLVSFGHGAEEPAWVGS